MYRESKYFDCENLILSTYGIIYLRSPEPKTVVKKCLSLSKLPFCGPKGSGKSTGAISFSIKTGRQPVLANNSPSGTLVGFY